MLTLKSAAGLRHIARASLPLLVAAVTGCTVGTAAPYTSDPAPAVDPSGSAVGVGDADSPPEPKRTSWTVFVYGNGDNVRSNILATDLAKIRKAALGSEVRVVSLADFSTALTADGKPLFMGGSEWSTFGGGASPLVIRTEAEQDLDSPAVLSASITRAFKENPADHYGVIIWTRGAVDGEVFGADTQDGTRPDAAPMTSRTMAGAIRQGLAGAGVIGSRALDFLGFDSSGAGRVEVAFEMKDLAQVLVSNGMADGSSSWAYEETFGFLGQHPEATGFDFAGFEASGWAQVGSRKGTRSHVALDTAKLGDLADATSSLVHAVATANGMANAASAAKIVGKNAGSSARIANYGDFFSTMARSTTGGVVNVAAGNVAAKFAEARIGAGDDATSFGITLPPSNTVAPEWFTSYANSAKAWDSASHWTDLLVPLAAYRAPRHVF